MRITDVASQKILEFYTEGKHRGGFRVRVLSGGCAGFNYDYTFDDRRPGDAVFPCGGISVLVDPESLSLVTGATLDYVEDFQQAGFVVQNPNSTASCGCGKSFGV